MRRALPLIVLMLAAGSTSAAPECVPRLWPAATQFTALPESLREALARAAQQYAALSPAPIVELKSAGIVKTDDARLRATRAALRDADHAAVLALAYRVDAAKSNLAAARDVLVAWANVNAPTGQPIDESKLDEMVWAYDLVRCDVSRADRDVIERWLNRLLAMKDAWRFGPGSDRNNHRTHQLKLQILIAAALNDTARAQRYAAQAREHARVNLDTRDGVSQDYRERDALHYHAYNLEAWNEIELITPCCTDAVVASAHFLWRKIIAGDVDHQFASSQVAIDRRRADAGHAYLAEHYDSARATRAALAFHTGRCAPTDPALRALLESGDNDPRLIFFAVRRALWNTSLVC